MFNSKKKLEHFHMHNAMETHRMETKQLYGQKETAG